MANKTVKLIWYCKVDGKGWRYFPAVYHIQDGMLTPKTGYVKEKGKETHYPQGRFMLRSYDAEGRTVYVAIEDAVQNNPHIVQEKLRSAQRAAIGRSKAVDSLAVLKSAAKEYIKDCEQRKASEAAEQARLVLREFLPLCKGITYTRGVNREHVFAFHKALRVRGCEPRTIANKHARLRSFFRFCKVDLSFMPPAPKYEKKLPTIYSAAEVKAIRAAADPYMRLVIDMALKLGLREQELVYACWTDIDKDQTAFRVQGKPRLGFTVKDKEERDIPLPADLLTMLSEWHKKRPNSTLIVGTGSDKPNTHLLRTLKRLAKRSGLGCGECGGCKGKLGECQEWTLHRFRRTYVTTLLRNGVDLKTVQHYAGHQDLDSTMRYLRPASTSESQAKINSIAWE